MLQRVYVAFGKIGEALGAAGVSLVKFAPGLREVGLHAGLPRHHVTAQSVACCGLLLLHAIQAAVHGGCPDGKLVQTVIHFSQDALSLKLRLPARLRFLRGCGLFSW